MYRGFVSGDIHDIDVNLPETGDYTFKVTSSTGDIDVMIFDADGRRVGYGNSVGNDTLQGNLRKGHYTIRLRMVVCLNPFGTCEANIEAFIDGDPMSFSPQEQRTAELKQDGQNSSPDLEACINFALRRNPGYDRTTAEVLCRNSIGNN